MTKRFILVITVLLLTLTTTAQERTDAEMISIAKAKLSKSLSAKSMKGMKAKAVTLKRVCEDSQYSMYATEDGNGYVVVARNKAFSPIIGYSTEPTTTEIPCCMQACLDMINENMEAQLESGETEQEADSDTPTYEVVQPLLTTYWRQGDPFNRKCPVDDYTGKRSSTGCVPLAMAMVMNYFKYPASVTNKPGHYYYRIADKKYSDAINDTINSTYQWDKMQDTYTSNSHEDAIEAVSQLIYDCGRAAGVSYNSDGTGGSTTTAALRLHDVFGYAGLNHTSKTYYRNDEWCQLIYDQLKAGCPLMHAGTDKDKGGHAFVLDGVDADGLVHINWGWGKTSVGYFNILALTPKAGSTQYDFEPNGFIYNLKPKDHLDDPEEQEYQLVVGFGKGANENGHYAFSLKEDSTGTKHLILNTMSVFNWTPVEYRGRLGVRFENVDNGNIIDRFFKASTGLVFVAKTLGPKEYWDLGFSYDHDQTPNNFPPGTYKIYFAAYNDDWTNPKFRCHIRQRYKGKTYWLLTIAEDGTLSLSNEIVTISQNSGPTGIQTLKTNAGKPANNNKYNLNGQQVGDDYKGIVIVNGRKVLQQ